MGERGPIEGEFTELNSSNNNQNNNNNNNKIIKKVALVSLVAGLLGGGIAVGGYNWYENRNVTSNNSLGTTKTSNIKVDVSSHIAIRLAVAKLIQPVKPFDNQPNRDRPQRDKQRAAHHHQRTNQRGGNGEARVVVQHFPGKVVG